MNNSEPKDKSTHNSDEQSAQPPSVRILETFKFQGSSQKPEAPVEPFPESVVDQLLQEADELYAKRKKSTRKTPRMMASLLMVWLTSAPMTSNF